MHADPGIQLAASIHGLQRPLVAVAAVAACILGVLVVFWPTTASMIAIWRRSETFQHCFAVVPIVLWLVWNERARLAAAPMRPWWPGLLLIGLLGALWLLGVLGAAQVVSQFAMVGLVGAVVLTLFGVEWARVLWFALLFLFFAVPFGEALVPWLMDWTADFTVEALRFTGVPVYREGVHFVIPTGHWSVIEACSGIKFLIASVMAGSLYAWLMYRSPRRRLAFLAASVVVPLVANWLRAYLIVMIGHLSNNRLMTNEDHIVFGWILFGAAMLGLYWFGARWREDDDRGVAAPPPVAAPALARVVPAAGAALALLVAWPLAAHALLQPAGNRPPLVLAAPAAAGGWQAIPVFTDWRPHLEGPAVTQAYGFRKGERQVVLIVAAFRDQTQASQVGSSGNQLVTTSNEEWKQTARGTRAVTIDTDGSIADPVRTAELRRARGTERLQVWQWYWLGERPTISAAQSKLALAQARLRRVPDTALWVALVAPTDERAAGEQALAEFARDMGPSLQRAFAETAQ